MLDVSLKRHRLENTSSERIQSCFRSYLVRRRLHQVWRGLLERQLAEIKKLNDDDGGLVKKLPAAVGRAAAMFQADIFVLKHKRSIFRSLMQPCMWFLHDGTG